MLHYIRGHSRSRNVNLFILLSLMTIMMSISFSLGAMEEEHLLDQPVFSKRPQRFSFGLGKRSVSPNLEEMLSQLKGWGVSGPHGLFKRSEDPSGEDLETLYRNMGRWGLAGPHGLFKRKQADEID